MCKLLSLLYERGKCQKVIVPDGNCQGDKDVNVGIPADYHRSITFIHVIKKAKPHNYNISFITKDASVMIVTHHTGTLIK